MSYRTLKPCLVSGDAVKKRSLDEAAGSSVFVLNAAKKKRLSTDDDDTKSPQMEERSDDPNSMDPEIDEVRR